MPYELTLKVDAEQYGRSHRSARGVASHLLIALKKSDYDELRQQDAYPVFLLCLEDPEEPAREVLDVRRYTHHHSVADWEPLASLLHGRSIVLLTPAVFRTENKAVKAIDKTGAVLTAMGASVIEHVIKPDSTATAYVEERRLIDEAAALEATAVQTSIADWLQEGDTYFSDEGSSREKGSVAPVLYALAKEHFEWFQTPENEPFAVLRHGPRYAHSMRRVGQYLTNRYNEATDTQVTPRTDLADCMASIEAACTEARLVGLELRSARDRSGDYWLDLGDLEGRVIRLNGLGWSLEERPTDDDLFFRRPKGLSQLPVPKPAADIQGAPRERLRVLLKRFVNVSDEDWPLLVAWMITHLIPKFVPPICLLVSESDAGKSTATQVIRFAVEGKLKKGSVMKDKADDIAVTMSSERLTVFNNVSKISKDQSDFLCQVVDGTEYTKRKLHTDADVATLEINPSVLMNGIETGALQSDFKTRAVKLELNPLYGERWSDDEIVQALRESHPEVLSCLLTITCEVLGQLPSISIPAPQPRMIDYARVLAALDRLWELGDATAQRFGESLDKMSQDAMDDLLFVTVHRLVVQHHNQSSEGWVMELSIKQLMDCVNSAKVQRNIDLVQREQRGMFERPEQMSGALRRAQTDWVRLGVSVERLGQRRCGDGRRETFYRLTFRDRGEETPWSRTPSVLMTGDPV